eukprot:m.338817 g.338817  ORF g.338817 m.338817 type:complete len:593 (+) comp18555_c0_seq1:178-1956(+)
MEIVHVYQRKRADFGRMCNFSDRPAHLLADIVPEPALRDDYMERSPCDSVTQVGKEFSEHEVNTETVQYETRGINHKEGGWAKDVDPNEPEQVERFRKKVEKDENYSTQITSVGGSVMHCLLQNNAIDIYEDYFDDTETKLSSDQPEAKRVNVFRDPNEITRPATSMSWHPDSGQKLAVAYSVLDFQKAAPGTSFDSYIWDIEQPTAHDQALTPSSPLVSLEYNPKDGHILIGGQYNGQIGIWDTRKGSRPIEVSPIEKSHRDPVYRATYMNTKSGTDAFSCSTDGQVLFWDVRKLAEPVEQLLCDPTKTGRLWGAVALEYESTMPTKFQVGTEQGAVVLFNKKAKDPADKIAATYEGHHGPVYSVERNPFFPKYFMSVGDWSMRIWCEDVRESSILWGEYYKAYCMTGCWSRTRPGVCFTGFSDGNLGIWDLLCKTNKASLNLQVSDDGIESLKPNDGNLVACGSRGGQVTLVELNDALSTMQPNEKPRVAAIFDRETSREKAVVSRLREVTLSKRVRSASAKPPQSAGSQHNEDEDEIDPIAEAEKLFWDSIKQERAKREKEENKKKEAEMNNKEAENKAKEQEKQENAS